MDTDIYSGVFLRAAFVITFCVVSSKEHSDKRQQAHEGLSN